MAPDNPGLLNHLLRVITQLKQAAIDPVQFRTRLQAVKETSVFDPLVAEAYAAYQDALLASNLYDTPGLYWQAVLLGMEQKPRLLESTESIVLDGFDDFTPSEFRLLDVLERNVSELVFGINYDEDPGRQDLYALSSDTMNRLANRFDVSPISVAAPEPTRHSEYAARKIFWRDPPRFPEELKADLTAIPCNDVHHEIETIGRRVKSLLMAPDAAPDRIAVVFRDLPGVAETIRAAFTEFGIPFRISHRPALVESAIGAFLVRFLEAARSWDRETVLDVLQSPWYGAGESNTAFAIIARTAQIITGYDEWTERLALFMARLKRAPEAPEDTLASRLPGADEIAEQLLAQLQELKRLHGLLPARAEQRTFAGAADALLNELGLEKTLQDFPEEGIAARERSALSALRELLEKIADADAVSEITQEVFLQRFLQGLRESSFACPDTGSGVVCCDAASIRGLHFDHVFFGGLNEGETPAPPAANAIYSDLDLSRLRGADIVLEGKREHDERERLLFHHVIDAARVSLTLSWRMLKGGGRESMRSSFLSEVITLFPESAGILEPPPLSDAFLPAPCDIASARDLRNAAAYGKLDAQALFPELLLNTARGTKIEVQRQDTTPFGIYDGVLASPELVDGLAAHYGEEHLFSVQQIETYIKCPFRFFAERVLKVSETELPEAEFDPLLAGLILHDALQLFHERFRGQAVPEIEAAAAQTAMREALDEAFRANAAAPRGAAAAEKRRMETLLLRYLSIEYGLDERSWKPEHFEVAFGRARGRSTDPLTTAHPFILDTEAGPIRFSGRIDRLDRTPDAVRIIDYKRSSTRSSGEIISGRSVQLSIYAWAAERLLLPGIPCAEAYYVPVGRDARQKGLNKGCEKNGWDQREQNALAAVARAVRGLRAGAFPPHARATRLRSLRVCFGLPNRCRARRAQNARRGGIWNSGWNGRNNRMTR